MGSGLWLGLGLGCVSLSLSVPGVSTARPAACADQPSRRSTACRGTRRGRPRRRWRARRPSRAAHRCPAYGDGSGPPGSYHPAAAVRSRRLAARSPCDESPSHGSVPRVAGTTGTRRTWPAMQAVRSPSRHRVSCQCSLFVGCCASTTAGIGWRRMEVRCGRGRAGRAGRAWLGRPVARERFGEPSLPRGREHGLSTFLRTIMISRATLTTIAETVAR